MKPHRKLENLNILIANNIERDEKIYAEDLKNVLKVAQQQNRLTCGVYECGKHLENNPDDVMLCVLPLSAGKDNPMLHIHRTLISAFCLEEGIPIINISSVDSIKNLLDCKFGLTRNSDGEENPDDNANVIENDDADDDNDDDDGLLDFNCLLVEVPVDTPSQSEEKILNILDYYQNEFPLIDLDPCSSC